MHLFIIYIKGILIGISDLVPGISGGTMAMITNIYPKLISSLNEINFTLWQEYQQYGLKKVLTKIHFSFLIFLFSGILTSIILFSHFILFLYQNYPIQIKSFFIGLIVISAYYLYQELTKKNIYSYLLLSIGFIIGICITVISPFQFTFSYFNVFLSGCIAICAMLLPGISGSFILLILGSYHTIIMAVTTVNIPVLSAFFIGCLVGLLSFSKILHYLLSHFYEYMLNFLIGLMLGSLYAIYPFKQNDLNFILLQQNINSAIIYTLLGGITLFLLKKMK